MPPAAAAGGPLPRVVREAGVRRTHPDAVPGLRHPLQLEVKDRPVEGALGQLGATVDADGHLRPKSLLGIAPELRLLVHCQTQLRQVAPDPHKGCLCRGWRAQQGGDVRHHRGVRRLGPPYADPHVARGTPVH